jgi:hypothetical protein
MPEQITTKINRTLPQKDFEFDEEIELNEGLLKGEGEDQLKRRGPEDVEQMKGKKKVKLA